MERIEMKTNLDKVELQELQKRYVLGTYAPETTLVRGNMSTVWDIDGNSYLDFTTGISVCNLGHCHPRVTEAIQQQAAKLVHVSNIFYNENQPQLASLIARNSFDGRVFFCNSGAEANEGMIKFARRWGHAKGKYEIICMEASFHGRTLATLAATGRSKYRQGFAPDVEGFVHVPFNDLEKVAAAISEKTAAILLEPVQGEGGIIPADKEFMAGLRELCDRRHILLLFDEVQCGMGRTGTFFAHQQYGIEPDAMSMAKSLGNGIPIGAFEVQERYNDILVPGTHATTFGGNPLACAAGIAVFEAFEEDYILDNCIRMGAMLHRKLEELGAKYDFVGEVRGLGLMVGVELACPVKTVIAKAFEKGLLVLSAGENVLRLLPALTIEEEELERGVAILDQVFSEI
jgi:predicted acetylornithine/succinylornithine family transaminase